MKSFFVALIALGLCAVAQSSTLTTTDGTTFKNVTTQRADPDGLYIEYALPGGGLGMSKVKFSRLSPNQQKQFGFDAAKARDYETQVAKSTEEFRQESIRMEQIASAARQARAVQDARIPEYRPPAMDQSSAPAAVAPGNNYGYDSSYWGGGGYGLIAVPRTGRVPPARTTYAPIVTPIPFPKLNTPHYPPAHQGNH